MGYRAFGSYTLFGLLQLQVKFTTRDLTLADGAASLLLDLLKPALKKLARAVRYQPLK